MNVSYSVNLRENSKRARVCYILELTLLGLWVILIPRSFSLACSAATVIPCPFYKKGDVKSNSFQNFIVVISISIS